MRSVAQFALRLIILAGGSGGLGLAVNAFSPHGIPILSSKGPGALQVLAPRLTGLEFEAGRRTGRVWAILDVRGSESFREGHPEGALHAPASDFIREYSRQGLDQVLRAADGIVVLCDSDRCPLGDRVAEQLAELGHGPVYVFRGGWEAYRESGFRIARGH